MTHDAYRCRGLLMPADTSKPVERVTINNRGHIKELLGGYHESTQYDHDALMLVHWAGRINGLPLNTRATNYIKTASVAAQRNPELANDTAGYGLYGDVVVIGRDLGEDVPVRLIEWFETNGGAG
jgi:hypothetical protein